jgi:hypothetical protein
MSENVHLFLSYFVRLTMWAAQNPDPSAGPKFSLAADPPFIIAAKKRKLLDGTGELKPLIYRSCKSMDSRPVRTLVCACCKSLQASPLLPFVCLARW